MNAPILQMLMHELCAELNVQNGEMVFGHVVLTVSYTLGPVSQMSTVLMYSVATFLPFFSN